MTVKYAGEGRQERRSDPSREGEGETLVKYLGSQRRRPSRARQGEARGERQGFRSPESYGDVRGKWRGKEQ